MDSYSKKIMVYLLVIFLFFTVKISAQENYISIIIPEEKETTTTLSKYRLAANTLPNSNVKLNGKKLKVYSSGAVVDLMKLEIGVNEFELESVSKGVKVTETFSITREEKKIESTPEDVVILEEEMILPDKDLWLDAGDILEVRVKGTPNANVSFMDGIKMIELPTNETKGIEGIYTGVYKVNPDINIENIPIKFKIEKDGETFELTSSAAVSMLPNTLPRVGVTKGERPFLNYGLGTDRLGGAKLAYFEDGIKL